MDFSFTAQAEERTEGRRIAAANDLRRRIIANRPKNLPPSYKVIEGNGKPPEVYQVERDPKTQAITKVIQVRPFPRTNDEDFPGHRWEMITTSTAVLGLGLIVEAGVLLDLMPYVAFELRRAGKVKVVVYRKP